MLHALRPHLIAFVVLRLYAAADLSFSLALSVLCESEMRTTLPERKMCHKYKMTY